jgi:peptidoglycan/LPS O-acetylase OafA/YrhL
MLRKLSHLFVGATLIVGLLFKFMHLPGANNLLIVSFIGMSFALVEIAFRIRKSVFAILPLLFSITVFFVLFRILHWPEPPYVLYGSYFLFLILVPVLLFFRGSKLKNNEPNISRHFMGLSALSFILCVVEFKLKLYPEGLGMEKYVHFILATLFLLGLILYIRQTLQIQQLKIKFQNEHKLLQCLGGVYVILLVLLTL